MYGALLTWYTDIQKPGRNYRQIQDTPKSCKARARLSPPSLRLNDQRCPAEVQIELQFKAS